MTLKGDYSAEVTYSAGDVVRYGDMGYVAKESVTGIPPTMDLYWRRLDQDLWDVVDMILDVAALNVSDTAISLKGESETEYLITVDESGETPELSVTAIEEDGGVA